MDIDYISDYILNNDIINENSDITDDNEHINVIKILYNKLNSTCIENERTKSQNLKLKKCIMHINDIVEKKLNIVSKKNLDKEALLRIKNDIKKLNIINDKKNKNIFSRNKNNLFNDCVVGRSIFKKEKHVRFSPN